MISFNGNMALPYQSYSSCLSASLLNVFPKKIKNKEICKTWAYVQSLCSHKESWSNAITEAEKLG